jgi:hypothetical protein
VSKKKFVCWQCGSAMKKKARVCRSCKKSKPQAVKAQLAFLAKSYGRPVKPVRAVKPAKSRCPDPACGRKGKRSAHACSRCGTPFTARDAVRAEEAAKTYLAGIPGSAEYYEAIAHRQWDPNAREMWRAEAAKARAAQGTATAHAASAIVKASGSRTLQEAFRRTTDPRAQAILRDVMGGGR